MESIAGFIAFKLSISLTYTWATQLSEGGLYIPTEEFLLQINKLEGIFQEYNKNGLKTEKKYIENLLNQAKEIKINAQVKKFFFSCRMFFRMKAENEKIAKKIS